MIKFNFYSIVVFYAIISLFSINQVYAYVNHNYVTPQDKIIEICCSWKDQLNDKILTYHINIDKKEEKRLKKIVENSLLYWEELLSNNIKFEKEKNKEDADIQIDFKKDIGEERGGKTVTHLDKIGYIEYVQIYISKRSYGLPLDYNIIEQITKHEVGHSLGLGHSNFATSLMYPSLDSKTLKIHSCEIAAINFINQLKLFEIKNEGQPKIQLKLFEREDYPLLPISIGTKYRC